MPDSPRVPSGGELSVLRARVAELEAENKVMAAQLAARDARLEAVQARLAELVGQVEELRCRLGRDSSTSSRPPSSDNPYQKKPKDRSLRGRSGRKPGKQPGAPSSAPGQSDHPDDTVKCPPDACGELTTATAPAGVTSLVQYGPVTHAKTALAVCANYLPVARAAKLVCAYTGVKVSAGFVAGVRGKAAARLGPFMDRVRQLLREAGVLYADETPARAAGKLHYVHIACTEFLTALHTGGRSAGDIDAGGVLAGYTGTIVRDGYAGYAHLTGALHAWCGAHGLRDLAGLYKFDPHGQLWARSMAEPLLDANAKAAAARATGQVSLNDHQLAEIRACYRGAVAKGIADNQHRHSTIGKDGLRLARRFRDHQDMILRFATDLSVGFTSNEAERGVRPVKVQQRSSGGCWLTLEGLADFATLQSYLSTAAKWRHRRPGRPHPAFHRRPLATHRHPARLNSYDLRTPSRGRCLATS